MAQYANREHVKLVGKLKEKGFSYKEIKEEMEKRTGKPFGYRRNKAIRYKKLYDQLFVEN